MSDSKISCVAVPSLLEIDPDNPQQKLESPLPSPVVATMNKSQPLLSVRTIGMIDKSSSTSEILTPTPSNFGIREDNKVEISPSVDEWISPDEGVLLLSEPPPLLSAHSISTSSVHTPLSSSSNPTKFASRVLRGNLTRTQMNRDPLTYYEITQVLGVGSMGSVAKVRKRAQAIGGSARKSVQERVQWEHRIATCFKLPLVGGLFSFCLRRKADQWLEEISERRADNIAGGDNLNSVTSTTKSTTSSEMIFAMKSIHLSRITDDTFVEELRNEVCILKTLDHPHIIKAIETFDHRNQLFVIMELCSGGDLCKLLRSDKILLCLDAHCFYMCCESLWGSCKAAKSKPCWFFHCLHVTSSIFYRLSWSLHRRGSRTNHKCNFGRHFLCTWMWRIFQLAVTCCLNPLPTHAVTYIQMHSKGILHRDLKYENSAYTLPFDFCLSKAYVEAEIYVFTYLLTVMLPTHAEQFCS